MIRDSDLIVRGEVLAKIQYLVERGRSDRAYHRHKAAYSEGYEDGLHDLADALSGFCHNNFAIRAAGPAARAAESAAQHTQEPA